MKIFLEGKIFIFLMAYNLRADTCLLFSLAYSRHPTTKWAQRSDKVYITIELPDAKDVKLNLQPDGHFYFSAASGADNVPYEIDFELFDKVNVEEGKASIGLRTICYLVKKAEKKWWSRLLRKEGKPPVFLKVDWDKWIDEDDEKENRFGDMDFGDMDFSNLDMGGAEDELDDDAADMGGAEAFDKEGADDELKETKAEESKGEESKTEGAQAAAASESEAKA
ncbi:co-chaperone protein p23-1 [Cocos nucifera]|nr:co-chaperone protein p23-1 [Cocos nucifera]